MFPQKSSEDDSDTVTIIGRKEKAEAVKEHLLKLIQDLVSSICRYSIPMRKALLCFPSTIRA